MLAEVQVDERSMAHRCFKCGGFWADTDTANKLTSRVLSDWRRISIDPRWFSGGSDKCPLDDMKLTRYSGESVPLNLTAKRCARCGKWWFSGDNLFTFKEAQEAKINYFRLWGSPGDIRGLLLPVLSLVILLSGLVVGLELSGERQRVAVPAQSVITQFTAVYTGNGRESIWFKSSEALDIIEYRKVGEAMWIQELVAIDDRGYVVYLVGLDVGTKYEVRILEQMFLFETK